MNSSEQVNADSTLLDFSSVLLDIDTEDKDLADDIIDLSSKSGNSNDNKNLSSVLSQIQDDGPAINDKKRESQLGFTKSKDMSNHTVSLEQIEIVNGETTIDKIQSKSPKMHQVDTSKNHSGKKQILLLISITVVVALTLFNIELRTRYLEQAFNGMYIEIEENITMQEESFQMEMKKIDASMKTILQDLQLVKTNYADLDNRYSEAFENSILTKADKVVLDKNVSVMGTEIQELKNEIATLKDRFNKIKTPVTKKPVVNNGLIVDLVSLTNAKKAEELVKKIYETGYVPSIKKMPFKNKSIYKISVSGFNNREQAKVFMHIASKKYGINNSRIRKS